VPRIIEDRPCVNPPAQKLHPSLTCRRTTCQSTSTAIWSWLCGRKRARRQLTVRLLAVTVEDKLTTAILDD
jgi:hypothetical protein